MKYQNVLVTGGAGFIGSHLCLSLKNRYPQIRVIAFDNLKRRGSELNVARLKDRGIDFVHGDVRNRADLDPLQGVDFIFECSAEPSVLAGYGDSPEYVIDTNLLGAVNCLELARKSRADVIFLSTSRVYPYDKINALNYHETEMRFELSAEAQALPGVSPQGISEVFPLDGVRSIYGATKLSAEFFLQEYIQAYGIRGVINRCGVVSGPWQMGKVDQGFVALWAASHLYKKPLTYIGFGGRGQQVRDVLHIDDLVDAVDRQWCDIKKFNGAVLNIGGGCGN